MGCHVWRQDGRELLSIDVDADQQTCRAAEPCPFPRRRGRKARSGGECCIVELLGHMLGIAAEQCGRVGHSRVDNVPQAHIRGR